MFEVNVNGRKQRYRSKPTMNVDTTGSSGDVSIPKPLTYDYMPEGYPSKSVETVTLMEEQEVAFTNSEGLMMAISPVAFELAEGDNLTVVWDGVNWDAAVTVFGGQYPAFGNLGLGDLGDITDHPFIYFGRGGGNALWATTDTAANHTIKVTATKTVFQSMSEDFIPQSAFTKATWDFIENKPFYIRSIDTDIISEEIEKSLNVGDNHVDLGIKAPTFIDGLCYNIEGEISITVDASGHTRTLPISGLYKAESNMVSLGEIYDDFHHATLRIGLYGENNRPYSSKLYISYSASTFPQTYTISANLTVISEVKQFQEIFIPETIQRIGNNVVIPSSTPDSTKKFRITVDDAGTISATEVT